MPEDISPEVAAERARVYELVATLGHGLHVEHLRRALKAIRDGKSRVDLVPFGPPWSLTPDGSAYAP